MAYKNLLTANVNGDGVELLSGPCIISDISLVNSRDENAQFSLYVGADYENSVAVVYTSIPQGGGEESNVYISFSRGLALNSRQKLFAKFSGGAPEDYWIGVSINGQPGVREKNLNTIKLNDDGILLASGPCLISDILLANSKDMDANVSLIIGTEYNDDLPDIFYGEIGAGSFKRISFSRGIALNSGQKLFGDFTGGDPGEGYYVGVSLNGLPGVRG